MNINIYNIIQQHLIVYSTIIHVVRHLDMRVPEKNKTRTLKYQEDLEKI